MILDYHCFLYLFNLRNYQYHYFYPLIFLLVFYSLTRVGIISLILFDYVLFLQPNDEFSIIFGMVFMVIS